MSELSVEHRIAILFQAISPPLLDGIRKPMKEGGYSDSGADIAGALTELGYRVVTPHPSPDPARDLDWVFPDHKNGIEQAIKSGANVLWLNTVLFAGHPVEEFLKRDVRFVGQLPHLVGIYDNKLLTCRELRKLGVPVPQQQEVFREDIQDLHSELRFPVVIKPVRGRGSQGVSVVQNQDELVRDLGLLFDSGRFGERAYLEQFLPGEEITVTVMPPGRYRIDGREKELTAYWCLPAVKRINHEHGVAPYSGKVAVMNNSFVMSDKELASVRLQVVYEHCCRSGHLIRARAPIRIDMRADEEGVFHLFDINLKPNMTGPGRPHRQGQDSLTALAARKTGWNYQDLVMNMAKQSWTKG